MRKIFYIFLLLITSIILVACGDKGKLTLVLPAEVSANVSDLNNIDSKTEIILTVAVP